MRIPIPLLVLLVFCLTLTDVDAAQGSADDRAQIVREFAVQAPFLKQRFDGNGDSRTEHPIVVINLVSDQLRDVLNPQLK